MPTRGEILKQKFANSLGLPFAEVLPPELIEDYLSTEGIKYYNSLYNPVVTLWAFLSQVIDTDKSLRNAVSRMIAWLSDAGESVPSPDNGAYCKARQRLPESLPIQLVEKTSQSLEEQASPEDLWCKRHVRLCDGSSVLMSDTPANQEAYPQHSNQKEGCGFPIAKIVVMFSLVTGAVMSLLIDSFNTSEMVMARELYRTLKAKEVALADQAYGTYVDLVLVLSMQADAVFRRHHKRHSDFRRGRKLGKNDHIVTWSKPKRCPKHMSQEEFQELPDTVKVREVRFWVEQPGFRTQEIILVTTLLDPNQFPKAKLAELYLLRWQVEVDLKHLKTTLGMEKLLGKTPAMVRKEIGVHCLAYNLIRTLMWKAAESTKVLPLRISFQGARQHFHNHLSLLAIASQTQATRLYRTMLRIIAHELLPWRPYRAEPRVKKQRPKPYPRMQEPRDILKAKLVA